MNLVMNPTKALLDTDSPPFVVREEPKGAGVIVTEVTLGNKFEERFWEDHMSILVLVVRVSIGIVDPVERGLHVKHESGESRWWVVTNLSMYSLIFASSGLSDLCDIVGRPYSGD